MNSTTTENEHVSEPSAARPMVFESQEKVLQAIQAGSEPNRIFWLMNGLATVIACYGLFANSPAVVIGAMVVAMLLGPIAGIALGLNESDGPLFRKASGSLVGGVIWILAIAVAIGLIHKDVPLTAEVLSRSDPRLFDLMIALAGGAAGAVAVLSPPAAGLSIVGVAIATALVPPLAAAGILLTHAEPSLAGGALLLALTNVVAIQLAFSLVLWVAGYRGLTSIGKGGAFAFLRRNLPSLAAACLLGSFFGYRLHESIGTALLEGKVRSVLQRNFDIASGFAIGDLRFSEEAAKPFVMAVIRGPHAPSAENVGAAQASLPPLQDGSKLNLRIRFIKVIIMTPNASLMNENAKGDGSDVD
jgi:uncharacterized hydrophobic protein (TIGR00271 family)